MLPEVAIPDHEFPLGVRETTLEVRGLPLWLLEPPQFLPELLLELNEEPPEKPMEDLELPDEELVALEPPVP